MRRISLFGTSVHSFIASSRGFYSVLALFTLSVLWVASFSIYPMAFDEEFHYGLIQIYATSALPFGIEHTPDMAQYGSATADASYLFHYLMSFPYRLFDALGLDDSAIILLLRYINITFVVAAFIVLRKTLLRAQVSSATATIGLAAFSLIPVLIMLTAQINYDNLLFLVIAWSFFHTINITVALRKKRPLPIGDAWLLVISLLIGMSIKYAFLPIALAIGMWAAGVTVKRYLPAKTLLAKLVRDLKRQWLVLSRQHRVAYLALSLLSLFFASHYVTNFVSYGHPIPACEQVFSEVECQAYGPWARNKLYASEKQESFQPLSYAAYMTTEFVPGMTQRLTFALAGKTNGFQTKSPLPIVIVGFILLTIIGAACLLAQILRRRGTWLGAFTLLLLFVYVGALSYQLYGDYLETGRPVAINGRYLLPLLPLVAVVFIEAIRTVFAKIRTSTLALTSVAILLALVIGGAGVGTYIVQSEAHWYHNGFAQTTYNVVNPVYNAVVPLRFDN